MITIIILYFISLNGHFMNRAIGCRISDDECDFSIVRYVTSDDFLESTLFFCLPSGTRIAVDGRDGAEVET